MKTSLSSSLLRYRIFYCPYRLVMALDVQMIAERLSMRGESVEDQASRFSEGQAVAFYGIGVVIGLDPESLFYPTYDIRMQRPQYVQLRFQCINLFNDVAHRLFS